MQNYHRSKSTIKTSPINVSFFSSSSCFLSPKYSFPFFHFSFHIILLPFNLFCLPSLFLFECSFSRPLLFFLSLFLLILRNPFVLLYFWHHYLFSNVKMCFFSYFVSLSFLYFKIQLSFLKRIRLFFSFFSDSRWR